MKHRVLPNASVIEHLTSNVGTAYAHHDALYVSCPMGIVQFTDLDFAAMSDEQIDAFIKVQFSQ